MRQILLISLLLCALLCTACSFAIDFAVVNGSDQPIEVRYQAERDPNEPTFDVDPVTRIGKPFLIKASPLRSGVKDGNWLPESEYQVDRTTGTISARLLPGEVLRIKWVNDANMGDNGPFYFPVQKIDITGAYGEIMYQGKQTSKAFIQETKYMYTLTYK